MIGIIDYNVGNIKSVENALKRLGQKFIIIKDEKDFNLAEKLILPGVGSADFAIQQLSKLGFDTLIISTKKPLLGICLGMQLLSEFSTEGNAKCLGVIKGKVEKFQNSYLKVPQVGWNKIAIIKESPLLNGIKSGSYFYFVNSYFFESEANSVVALTAFGFEYPSIVQKNNFFGVQFHPEKSGKIGLQLLNNFCTLC